MVFGHFHLVNNMKTIINIAHTVMPHVILVTAVFLAFGILLGANLTFAQLPGGGFNITIVMYCTCGPGYLAFIVGVGSTTSGLYYFGPQTLIVTGTGFGPAAWLGYYTPGAGTCFMYVALACITVPANLMLYYGGSI